MLLALENAILNSEIENLQGNTSKTTDLRKNSRRDFEDVEILSVWKADQFKYLKDCDTIIPKLHGTFPLRSKSSNKSYTRI